MNDRLQRIFGQLLIAFGPFIIIGVVIACVIGLIILSWYVLLWGFIIGLVLWIIAVIKSCWLPKKAPTEKRKGRIIDHDQNK